MIKKILTFIFLGILFTSCTASKTQKANSDPTLEGTWELNYINGPGIAFDGLYPDKKPTINFELKENRVSGNNSCNSFTGKLSVNEHKIDFTQPMAVTKMMCMDNSRGEQVFMGTLSKITSYDITDDGKTLHFISGDIAMMRFTKK